MSHTVTLSGPEGRVVKGLGWLRDFPDIRDYTAEADEVQPLLAETSVPEVDAAALPGSVDLREWCSAVEDQREIGSCTAQAGVGMVEYYERRAFGRHINASRLFLYKVTRRLGGFEGDSGAFLRTTIGAMALFGVPPEEYWRYRTRDFDREPPAFCYAFAQNYRALTYYRLDPPGKARQEVLGAIKAHLVSKLPSMFGFTVYTSIDDAWDTGAIPFPTPREQVTGGHAVMAVGYDDNKKIKGAGAGARETTGAFRIRNSWGRGWGDEGYGWLPYDYVLRGLADDWWVLLKSEWVDTRLFKT